jgi:hypothetical protein
MTNQQTVTDESTGPFALGRISTRVHVAGRARTSLPARERRTGPEAWHYPEAEGDDASVVRGED